MKKLFTILAITITSFTFAQTGLKYIKISQQIVDSKGDTLNGWMLKPLNFDPAKKYPVLFCNYGGPGSQQVSTIAITGILRRLASLTAFISF